MKIQMFWYKICISQLLIDKCKCIQYALCFEKYRYGVLLYSWSFLLLPWCVRTRLLTWECEDTLSTKASFYVCEYIHIDVIYTLVHTHTGQNRTCEILVWNHVSPSTLLFCPILQLSLHQPTWTIQVNPNSEEWGCYQYKLTGNLHMPVGLCTAISAAASIILINVF